jgi:hypothetical protein
LGISSTTATTKNSVLYKHKLTDHADEETTVGMELTGKCWDVLTRQADARNKLEPMKSKSDFNHPPATIANQNINTFFKETSRSGILRGSEHLGDFLNNNNNNKTVCCTNTS